MSKTLANKRVVITDVDAFMGPAIAELFAEEGADLVSDRRDLRVPSAAGDLIAEAGHVDVLIANLAATYSGSLTQDITDSEMMEMFERLVFPLHRLTRAVLPQMLERRSGKIIVVGSAAGLRGQPRRQTYSAARGAQQAYVRRLAPRLLRSTCKSTQPANRSSRTQVISLPTMSRPTSSRSACKRCRLAGYRRAEKRLS
jgi:2-keto-3-deoxy-L-fuconate dehydrogenase